MMNWWNCRACRLVMPKRSCQAADFIKTCRTARFRTDIKDGLATDYVTDAVLKSAKTQRWEKVKKLKR